MAINWEGIHNTQINESISRLEKANTYKDLSTIIICPTRGNISATVISSWMSLIKPMNQKVVGPLFFQGKEVGEAYENAISMILSNGELSKWKYLLTIEEDNAPPPDALIRLYENMDKFDVIGGLYWTKGVEGQPMIYGDVKEPTNFRPQVPLSETVQQCYGLGMGCTLFKIDIFKDSRVTRPFFKTCNDVIPGVGVQCFLKICIFSIN